MRKPRSLQDYDVEIASLQPPSRRDVVAPVVMPTSYEEMPSDEDKSAAAAEDVSMASSDTTQKIENHSTTASFYSVASYQSQSQQAMRHDEENDDIGMTNRSCLRPPASQKCLDAFPATTAKDAEGNGKVRAATTFPHQQVRWTGANNEVRREGKAADDVGYSLDSVEAAKQCASARAPVLDPSDYSVASSEASKQYEKTMTEVSHMMSGNPASDDNNNSTVAWRQRAVLPQISPGAVRVSGVYSITESDQHSALSVAESVQLADGEVHSSVVSQAGEMVTAYAVDDDIHEARLVNTKKKLLRRCLWTTAIVVIVVVAVVVPTVYILKKNGNGNGELQFSSFTGGLCSPRHLKVHEGQLFVAEAGVGPEDPDKPSNLCVPGISPLNEDGLCFGNTGRVSAFPLDGSSPGEARLTGLTSGRPPKDGSAVYGASSVDFDANGAMFTLIGLGFVSANDTELRDAGLDFACVLRGDQVVTSPWVPLFENNYAGVDVIETNPFHMLIYNGVTYVVDAGADLLYTYLNVTTAGTAKPDSVIVLPKVEDIPAVVPDSRGGPCNGVEPPPNGPAYCGQYNNSEGKWLYRTGAVPTAVRVNPMEPNKLYVSYLGGGPMWNEPVSGIFSMDLVNGIPQNDTLNVMIKGFYAVIDFGFYGNDLFVLETNPSPSSSAPFDGRLSRVSFDSDGMTNMTQKVIPVDLFQPVGMMIHEDTLFVSNNTFNMGMDDCNGQILKANLS